MRWGGWRHELTETILAAFGHPQLVGEKIRVPHPLGAWGNTPQEIEKSSSFLPAFNCKVTHLGCLPRPDHVSAGSWGFRYLANTGGYGRRSAFDSRVPAGPLAWSRANRRSSSSFSAIIFAVSRLAISLCRAQSSSMGIVSKLRVFTFAPQHPGTVFFQLSGWPIQQKKSLYFESTRIVANRAEQPSFFLPHLSLFICGTYRLCIKVN
jgi:hypothetical protein